MLAFHVDKRIGDTCSRGAAGSQLAVGSGRKHVHWAAGLKNVGVLEDARNTLYCLNVGEEEAWVKSSVEHPCRHMVALPVIAKD